MSTETKVLTVQCETAGDYFGNADTPTSYLGEVSVRWLRSRVGEGTLETGSREYQREKVATTEWKQSLMQTILCSPYARIPQIHIRVISTPTGLKYEIIDGQQRVTSILDYIKNVYPLADKLKSAGVDLGNKTFADLERNHPNIHNDILNYRITAIWYEALDDAMVSDLFVKVLNNQNNLNPQEIRNAIRGLISEWVRNSARFEPHPLFSRITKTSAKKAIETKLEHIPSLKLGGRMEVDEWLSQLIYMFERGLKDGVTSQKALTSWVQNNQLPGQWGAVDSPAFKQYKKRWNTFLDYCLTMVKAIPKDYMAKVTPMNIQLLFLYAWDIENNRPFRMENRKNFITAYYDTISKWSDQNKKVYVRWHQILNKKQMPPMKELFGGKNPNAIQTIMWILDREISQVDGNGFDWGIIEVDPRKEFSREDIIKKWKEQDKKCYYTKRELTEDELVGDHYIPRSWGIVKGGVTEYHNLVVTNRHVNGDKLNMHGDDYIKKLKGDA